MIKMRIDECGRNMCEANWAFHQHGRTLLHEEKAEREREKRYANLFAEKVLTEELTPMLDEDEPPAGDRAIENQETAMCILGLLINCIPGLPFIAICNRDEELTRPSSIPVFSADSVYCPQITGIG